MAVTDLLTHSAFEPEHTPARERRGTGHRPVRAEDERLRHAAELFRLAYCALAVLLAWLSINLVLLGAAGPTSLVGRGVAVLPPPMQLAGGALVSLSCLITLLDAALLWLPHSVIRRRITGPLRLWAHFSCAVCWAWLAMAVAIDPAGPPALPAILTTNIVGGLVCAWVDGVAKNRVGGGDAAR